MGVLAVVVIGGLALVVIGQALEQWYYGRLNRRELSQWRKSRKVN